MFTFVFGFLAEIIHETGAWFDRILPFPRLRRPLRNWRRRRPFWAGLLAAAGGVELMALPMAPLPLMLKVGVGALSAVAVGLVMIAGGLFFVFAPAQRLFVSVVTAIASLTSLATSNLGGLGIGCGLGLLGASMAFGWMPDPPAPQPQGRSTPAASVEPEAVESDGADERVTGPSHETPVTVATAGDESEAVRPKAREGRTPRGGRALYVAMPVVLAAALTVAIPQPGAHAAERCDGGSEAPTWPGTGLPRPELPWKKGPSKECEEDGPESPVPTPGGGTGDDSGPSLPGGDAGDGKAGKRPGDDDSEGDDPRQKPGEWQLPCLSGPDTGGAGNQKTGPPASEGGTAEKPYKEAEPGEVNEDDDLTPRRPPLVVGDQPGPGRAEYAVSPGHPTVSATRLDAYDAVIHGSTYLKTADGPLKVLWVHAERIVAKDYHLEQKGPDGTTHTIDVQLDIRNVDVYATYLNGSIEIPKLNVNTPRICIGADVIPANLPVAAQLPVLSLDPVEAGQVLVDTSDVRFEKIRTDIVGRKD